MIYINALLLLIIIVLLIKSNKTKKENVINEIKKDTILLKKPPVEPSFEEYDKDCTLLKDVLESIKLENWTTLRYEKDSDFDSNNYVFEMTNPTKDIKIRCRIYYRSIGDNPHIDLGTFTISSDGKAVSYNSSETLSEYLILKDFWEIIIEKDTDDYNSKIKEHEETRKIISDKLIALKRDKKLKSILC